MVSNSAKVESTVFEPVAGSRVSSTIVAQIRQLIRGGDLAPGDRLPPERDLAEAFNVSRVSVRDALRVLEALGLVAIRVGAAGGAFVTVPDHEVVGESVANLLLLSSVDPEDVAETRLVMELGIITLACLNATEDDLADLEQHSAAERQALSDGIYDRRYSEEFHAKLGAATGNQAIALLARSFRGPLSMFELRSRRSPQARYAKGVEEHADIVVALREGDLQEARRRVAEHLTFGLPAKHRRRLMESFVGTDR